LFITAAIHQLCFTTTSSLTFAVGQVQDAGLIFLSAMASSVVQAVREHEQSFSMLEVLATTLFTLASATALLGIALIITGKMKLASFVQYLPMPVVGGYLAYIGFYCLEAGLSMMSGKTIKGLGDWVQLCNIKSLLLIAPGVIAGLISFIALTRINHVAVLPLCMLTILAVFYSFLFVAGYSLEEARAVGWVAPLPTAQYTILDVYGYYDFSKMNFHFLVPQIPSWIAMYFVVAFSSSLDVAAVEMSLGTPLDHNHELQTVGISNLVSGLTGGFTGSYIFSQTIFTLRANLNSRLTGALIFILEVVVVLCPYSIIAYVPKVFFGALQTLIAADLMMEWMWHARHKMLFREYAIVWLSFIAMSLFNLEIGIILGIVTAGFNFILSYIAVSSVRRVAKRSRVERDLRERALLQNARLAIVALELDGFIFFGSSVKMMEEVRRHVLVPASEMHSRGSSVETIMDETTPLKTSSSATESDESDSLWTLDDHYFTMINNVAQRRQSMHAVRTRFFILDFERVRGVDATAVRSCFNATKQLLAQHGIALLFANVPKNVERLLRVHDVIEDTNDTSCLLFDTLDKALEWCEDELMIAQGVTPLSESIPRDGEKCSMQLLHELLPPSENEAGFLTKEIGELYIEPVCKKEGELVYRTGDAVAGVFFVGYGKIDVYLPSIVHENMGPGFEGKKRVLRVCQGGIMGAAEMTLHKRYHFSAEACAPSFLFFLSKNKYRKMKKNHPEIASRFQEAMVQTLARSVMESNLADD
jgi:SulP family sulfate permease